MTSVAHYTKESLFPFYPILRIREILMIMQGFRLRFHRVADLITISYRFFVWHGRERDLNLKNVKSYFFFFLSEKNRIPIY